MYHVFKNEQGLLSAFEVKKNARYERLVKHCKASAVDEAIVKSVKFESLNNADLVNGKLVYNKSKLRENSANESRWQKVQSLKVQLLKVNDALTNYERDNAIPEKYSDLRVMEYSEQDYISLLSDRKALVEYIKQDDFPECGRPTLSGLV